MLSYLLSGQGPVSSLNCPATDILEVKSIGNEAPVVSLWGIHTPPAWASDSKMYHGYSPPAFHLKTVFFTFRRSIPPTLLFLTFLMNEPSEREDKASWNGTLILQLSIFPLLEEGYNNISSFISFLVRINEIIHTYNVWRSACHIMNGNICK